MSQFPPQNGQSTPHCPSCPAWYRSLSRSQSVSLAKEEPEDKKAGGESRVRLCTHSAPCRVAVSLSPRSQLLLAGPLPGLPLPFSLQW